MNDDSSVIQVIGLAAVVGFAVLVGFWGASRARASPGVLSCCVGVIMGIIPGTIAFEFLPALKITSGTAPLVIGMMFAGFVLTAIFHNLVQRRWPVHQSFEDIEMSSFILAVVTDNVVEGFTLAFSSALSVGLLLFTATAFVLKNILEGFTEATVLQWEEMSARRVWAAGLAAAMAVVIAAALSWWFAEVGGPGEGARRVMFATVTGMLVYISVFQLARNLEWNAIQRVSAITGFAVTGAVALSVGQ